MKLVENLSKEQLKEISSQIGEAFVTNDLFHEFGTINDRKELVLKYMDACVTCVYESKTLYCSDDHKGYIGLAYSDNKKMLPQIKMLFKLIWRLPFPITKKFLGHIKQIIHGNEAYTKNTYLEILMVCVRKEYQKQGVTRELFEFAQRKAKDRMVPMLVDTDMEDYAKIYQHYGCNLYNTITASNGITRYNLVWDPHNVPTTIPL